NPMSPTPFTTVTDASVAFDRSHNFYVLVSEQLGSATGVTRAAGAIVLWKFSFSGFAPTFTALPNQIGVPTNPAAGTSGKVLYEWVNADAALSPMLTVDNNLPVDPDTGVPDPFAGAVYVGFSTDYTAPTGATNFNPNSIKLMASLDGGLNFTTQAFVNNNRHVGPQRATAPRLVVSQGSTSGATPGQVSIVYDDFGSLSTATPPRSTIRMNRVRDGGMGVFVQSPIMNDTTGHIHHQPDMTTPPTDFSLPVSFDANPDFGGSTDLNVTV